jgi:hypothetical protein
MLLHGINSVFTFAIEIKNIKIMIKRKLTLGLFAALAGGTAALNVHLNNQENTSNLSLYSIEVLANELCTCEQGNGSTDPIFLKGCLTSTGPKSLNMPFQAIKNPSHIDVYYSVNLTNITVKIVNASGQILYSNNVNPVAGEQLYISLSGLPAGDYTIVFTAPNGNSIYGDFEI